MLARLPIRLRLTLPFAAVIALILAATGFFVYHRVSSTLLSSVDQGLRGQAAEATARVQHGKSPVDRDAAGGPSIGQVIGPGGHVERSSPARLAPLLSGHALAQVLGGRTIVRSGSIPGVEGDWRLLGAPVRVDGRVAAVVIGASTEPREEALDRLSRELLLGGPLALLVASIAGYFLAAAALRPVEAMRRRAASIGASTPGSRLPTPRSRDEVSRLADTLNDMLGRLEAALEHERRFVDDASHELRTPLALLRAELEIALRRPRSREELERVVQSAAADTDRLGRLAEDLLLVARSDQGRLPIRRERIEVEALLGEVASRYEPRVRAAGRSLRLDPGAPLRVEGDPDRLGQAIGNLVENALLHGAGEIVLSGSREDGRIELHVTDEGSGLPPHFLPRAFDRFSRADEARGQGGSGLGLAIVKVIAAAHGGEAGVVNRPAGGVDAWISLSAPHSGL